MISKKEKRARRGRDRRCVGMWVNVRECKRECEGGVLLGFLLMVGCQKKRVKSSEPDTSLSGKLPV